MKKKGPHLFAEQAVQLTHRKGGKIRGNASKMGCDVITGAFSLTLEMLVYAEINRLPRGCE